MTATDDPVAQIARWRPRPESVECRRLSGAIETYPITSGRRAWQRLRSLLPVDAVELTGRSKGAIVGRWQAPTVAPDAPDAPDAPEHDEPDEYEDTPSTDAALIRWVMREMRGVYSDQLRATREVLAVMADAMRMQREALVPRVERSDDDDEPGFGKISDLLNKAGTLFAMQQAASRASASSGGPTPPPRPPRDTTAGLDHE